MASVTLWLLIATGVLVGGLLGGTIALLVLRRGGPGGDSLRHELDDYRRDVAEHYAETARRVDALTHAYKAVYDHLEDGAYRLVGERELRERLDDASHEPVTIEGIGQRVLQRPDERDGRRADGRPGAADAAARAPHARADDARADDAPHEDDVENGRGQGRPDDDVPRQA